MKSDEAKRKKLYVERDISWMYFNQRILLEAAAGSSVTGTTYLSGHLL